MTDRWSIELQDAVREDFSSESHDLIRVPSFLSHPGDVIENACLQKFAKITPQYPGIRAPIPSDAIALWLGQLSPLLDATFGTAQNGWEMQAWFSIVTASADELIPLQRFPHVDGTDPHQIAMMLYLHHTDHGGTAFFRHRSTGLEALTQETFSHYRAALEKDVRMHGLPPPAYVTDGAPFFDRIYASKGAFNEAIFYRGNVLHSGVISHGHDLPADPRTGRLTINAFFRPSETR